MGLFNYSKAPKRSIINKYDYNKQPNINRLMKKYKIKRNSIEPDNGYVLSPEELERFNKY